VIDGLALAVGSMELGERSTFAIHPDYGYGEKGRDPLIPPNAFLEFDIELSDIRDQFFNAIYADRSNSHQR
jgi:FKBP-type peptidyl-prolyl cis-trans isomerase